jgi:hypothetical protein
VIPGSKKEKNTGKKVQEPGFSFPRDSIFIIDVYQGIGFGLFPFFLKFGAWDLEVYATFC